MTPEDGLRHERRHPRRKAPQEEYHHIPCSAALGFALTATPEPLNLGKAHKLARPITEHYAGETPCKIHQRQSLTPKSFGLGVYCTGEVEISSSSSGGRVLRRKTAKRSSRHVQLSSSPAYSSHFGGLSPEYAHCMSSHQHRSMASPLKVNDRPDWTEQDECSDPHPASVSASIFSKVGPLLRKSENIWIMRNNTSK